MSEKKEREALRRADPHSVVAGFLVALEEVIAGAPSETRVDLRYHAAQGLRRAAEKYRLDLLAGGAEMNEVDADLEYAVDEVRRTYLAATLGSTQPSGEA